MIISELLCNYSEHVKKMEMTLPVYVKIKFQNLVSYRGLEYVLK